MGVQILTQAHAYSIHYIHYHHTGFSEEDVDEFREQFRHSQRAPAGADALQLEDQWINTHVHDLSPQVNCPCLLNVYVCVCVW